jgi:hypothetical protein
MTDTPRTTATAMEERHLWAQSILDGDYGTLGQRPFLYRDALADAHADRAALRDRLAWAEEREREAIDAWDAYAHQEDEGNRKEYWRRWHTVDDAVAALLAAPTDGAAPARHDEGGQRG